MNILEQLKSVLCDPSGKCCITGSDEDRAIVDRALQALAEQPAQQEPPSPQAREPLLREIAALSANALDDYKMIQKLMAERQPLTDEQIEACIHHVDEDGIGLFAFARAIEAAHGIKCNELEQPAQQEPVAWCIYCDGQFSHNIYHSEDLANFRAAALEEQYPKFKRKVVPLYTAPQKHEWAVLTKEEVDSWELPDCPTVFEFVQFIEDKIKDRNT